MALVLMRAIHLLCSPDVTGCLVPLRRAEQRCRPAAAAAAERQVRGRLGHGRAVLLPPGQHGLQQVAQRLQVRLAPLQLAQAAQRMAAYVGGRLRTSASPLSSNSPLQHWPACAVPHAAQKAQKVCASVPESLRARQSPLSHLSQNASVCHKAPRFCCTWRRRSGVPGSAACRLRSSTQTMTRQGAWGRKVLARCRDSEAIHHLRCRTQHGHDGARD